MGFPYQCNICIIADAMGGSKEYKDPHDIR